MRALLVFLVLGLSGCMTNEDPNINPKWVRIDSPTVGYQCFTRRQRYANVGYESTACFPHGTPIVEPELQKR